MATLSAGAKAKLEAWLGAGTVRKVDFVLTLSPVRLSDSATVDLRFSAYGYRLATTDSPPRFELPSGISISILNESLGQERKDGAIDLNQFRPGRINYGPIRLLGADGELDYLKTDYSWVDAVGIIEIGYFDEAYANFETLWPFLIERNPAVSRQYLEFQTKSGVFNVHQPAQADLFAGSGGLEGGAELNGKPKPKAFGELYSVSPPRVGGSAAAQYLFDPDGVNSIDTGYEGGTPDTTGHSGYTETLAAGHCTLGNEPQGDVTFDLKGQKFDGGAYNDTPPKIADEILTSEGLTGFPSADITAVNTALGSPNSGTWIYDNFGSIGEAVQWALGPRVPFFPDQDGSTPRMVVVEEPSGETSTETYAGLSSGKSEDGAMIRDIRIKPLSPPVYHVSLGFQELWNKPGTLFVEDAAEIARQSEDRQYATATDATVQTDYPGAKRLFAASPLTDSTEAGTEATALLTLFKVPRVRVEVDLTHKFFHSWVGEYVTLKFDRYGLDLGQKFLVVGVRFSLNPTSRSYTLILWGEEPGI